MGRRGRFVPITSLPCDIIGQMQVLTDDQNAHIHPLVMNGLVGRMLVLPRKSSRAKREILFLYGIHSSLERMNCLAESLQTYGRVIMPDLPGIGGMESFYKIGEKPLLDTYADYLASFIKLCYKRKKVTVVGFSFGFMIVTRMLQRYPEMTDKIELLVSVSGMAHYEDVAMKRLPRGSLLLLSRFASRRLPSKVVKTFILNKWCIKAAHNLTKKRNANYLSMPAEQLKEMIDYDTYLWKINDVRTYFAALKTILTFNNCLHVVKVPVQHVSTNGDQWLDEYLVEQHLHIIFSEVGLHQAKVKSHMPTLLVTSAEAGSYFPRSLRKLLHSGV